MFIAETMIRAPGCVMHANASILREYANKVAGMTHLISHIFRKVHYRTIGRKRISRPFLCSPEYYL